MNFYNENDPAMVEWLETLIMLGLIPDGKVDSRSITEIKASEIRDFNQWHFFAGLGGWAYALELAGWPEDRQVMTGSCPCQPFSQAGKQKGKTDARHLFPIWLDLIGELEPSEVFGEQVSAAIAHGWLDDVYQGLEAQGYAVGSAILPACSVGAPHKRDRLWFVGTLGNAAESTRERRTGSVSGEETQIGSKGVEHGHLPVGPEYAGEGGTLGLPQSQQQHGFRVSGRGRGESANSSPMGIPDSEGRIARQLTGEENGYGHSFESTGSGVGPMADAESEQARSAGQSRQGSDVGNNNNARLERRQLPAQRRCELSPWQTSMGWIDCADGKQRLVEPGIQLLANGVPGRVDLLRGFGNAIVPQIAAEFIGGFLDAEGQL